MNGPMNILILSLITLKGDQCLHSLIEVLQTCKSLQIIKDQTFTLLNMKMHYDGVF